MVKLPLPEFRKLNTPDSPTLLLNGKDLFPAQDANAGASCCRLYKTTQGLRSHPTASMVQRALEARLFTDQPPFPRTAHNPSDNSAPVLVNNS